MRATHLALAVFYLLGRTSANIINVTIDDTYGNPTNGQQIQYFPSTGAWQNGNGCQPCTAKATPATDAWLGTWHDASFNPNSTATNSAIGQLITASVQFTGTAVYVNCILTRSFTSPDGNTDMTFFLDDSENPAGVFQQSPNGDTSYHFNSIVFSAADLTFGPHRIRMETGHAGLKALVLLDSIIYTTDDSLGGTSSASSSTTSTTSATSSPSETSSSRRTNVGIIVGPIVAASLVIVGLVAVVMLHLRRGRDKGTVNNYASVINPFTGASQVMTQAESSVVTVSEHPTSSVVAQVSKPTKERSEGQTTASSADTRRHARPLPSAPSWPGSLP